MDAIVDKRKFEIAEISFRVFRVLLSSRSCFERLSWVVVTSCVEVVVEGINMLLFVSRRRAAFHDAVDLVSHSMMFACPWNS